jgi:hypothetical protein
MDWTDFFTGITSAATSITKAVVSSNQPFSIAGAPGSVYIPSTGAIVQTNTGLASLAGGNSTLILILLAVVLVFALRK